MANKQPQQKTQAPVQQKTQAPVQQKPAAQKQSGPVLPFIFDKSNYVIMVGGLAVIIIGFLLMAGGGEPTHPEIFPKEAIYSFRRITLAPIVIMIGFGIEIYAILKRPAAQ